MKRIYLQLLPLIGLIACQPAPPGPSSGCGMDARYRSVEHLLKEGTAQLAAGDAAGADAAFEHGLEMLANRYYSRAVIDDTGMVLVAIRNHQRAEGLAAGAPQKGRILESRLRQYRDDAEPEGCR